MTDLNQYLDFLNTKITIAPESGFDLDDRFLDAGNKPHQSDSIRWAARMGRALIAMSFGLGKTRIQCELARAIYHDLRSNPNAYPFLVICPLGVKHQFVAEDGPALGMKWRYVRDDQEILDSAGDTPFLITNYERVRDGNITTNQFCGVSLDEGSVLRSLGSKTSQVFRDRFKDVPYRFVCTATPSPNDFKELIYYADFLGIMDQGQALTRFFKRDSSEAGHLTLMESQEEDFWMWVSSWALFLSKPSDLGYSDEGYDLPELRVHWHRLPVDQTRAWNQTDNKGQHRLFLDAAGGVREASAEKRATLSARVAKMQKIVAEHPERNWLIWHTLEDERRAIEATLPEAVTVYGSQELELREQHILDFSHGKIHILATKPEIAGSGCNFQRHCYSNIFLGIDYKFQDFIQAVHRTHRFLQDHPVDVHILYSESEDDVVKTLQRKWAQHDRLAERMQQIIKKYGLQHQEIKAGLARTIGVKRMEVNGKYFKAVNNDCVIEIQGIPSDSVGLVHTSIPFGNHYEYTVSYEDFGHNPSDEAFWKQMDFLIPELLRVTKPGRVAAIHVKDRILYGHQTKSGIMEVAPFSDECVMAFRRHGWLYEGRRTIVTDVVRENAATYRLGWTEMTKDASKMGSGLPEYLLLFRKAPTDISNSYADDPVTKSKADYSRARWQVDAHSFWRSNGNTPLYPGELYDYQKHVEKLEALEKDNNLPASWFYDPPRSTNELVWDDVVSMRTLNSEQSRSREEKHICPLPFDVVERTINLYSNPGDLVLDPFAGLFTVPYIAVKLGRLGHGIELNIDYFNAGVHYLQKMEEQVMTPTLFDYLEEALEKK
jgi:DNA modification methylase